ncbi:MAG: hypothetical protein JU82_07805 [Sulfuricurvum sp. MLSB]|uniref:hypothetical protein n=1 Tax=unclassified Sulfuricurvum TaxID=2632390 RepID=UPI00050034DB|nr:MULTISPECIES: hypothetical protein [unclassified Sulfuricurvum]KFN39246.1 MAG: hypothetical protein JU82_07805 [Sulfuricurvum sp. MLSB]
MKYLIALCMLTPLLWGAKVLSYNIYDRNDRVDVMLTFDTPYEGVLRQNRQGDTIVVKLEEAFIESSKVKDVNSAYLNKLTIAPQGEHLEIVAKVSPEVTMQASKTSDSYGLRLRFMNAAGIGATATAAPVDETALSGLPTKKSNEFEQSYYVVIAILVIGIAILIWLKQNIAKRAGTVQAQQPKVPWLFNNKPAAEVQMAPTPITPIKTGDTGGIHIRFQKSLDSINSVAMLDYGTQSYLVLLGTNTVLLDKFQDNIPVTQNEFESLLQSKHRELDGFFQIGTGVDEPFDAYKEKASGVY